MLGSGSVADAIQLIVVGPPSKKRAATPAAADDKENLEGKRAKLEEAGSTAASTPTPVPDHEAAAPQARADTESALRLLLLWYQKHPKALEVGGVERWRCGDGIFFGANPLFSCPSRCL